MKNKLSLLLVMLLLSSCNVTNPSNSATEKESLPSNSELKSESNESSSVDSTLSESTTEDSSTTEDTTTEDSSPVVEENPFEGYHELMDGLYVNHMPGVYNGQVNVEFKLKDPNSSVYYTLDHTIPTQNSVKYNSPIPITKIPSDSIDEFPLTRSVDAILAGDNGGKCVSHKYIDNIQNPGNYPMFQKQNVITIKYIDGEGNEKVRTLTYLTGDFDIPVVSLSMPYDNWFGTENGFYNKIREEIEHRVNMEYFDSEYNEYFYINSQIKLGGNWTLGYPLRTLNLNFNKDENGDKQKLPKTHLFKERKTRDGRETLTSFKRFRLHSGGNAFEEWTGFNDAIIQNMMDGTHASTTGYRPCIVYCNGEYWGLQYIREHYKDVYFAENYDVEKDHVAMYEYNGSYVFDSGDDTNCNSFISDMLLYLDTHSFSDNAVYEEFINTYVDIESFMDVFIAELYAGNWDFVGNNNNLKLWRVTQVDPSNPYADGKIRCVLHDIDFAFTDVDRNFLSKTDANSYSKFKILSKLLQNDKFKEDFYNRAVELCETNLNLENAVEVMYSMALEVSPYKADAMYRWGNHDGYDRWIKNINTTYNNISKKDAKFLRELKETLETY